MVPSFYNPGPEDIKLSMLNSEKFYYLMLTSLKNIKNSAFFRLRKPRMLVGILTFMGRKNFMLSRVEHEKSFITSDTGRLVD